MEIKNQTYYLYKDKVNLENFKSNLLKINKSITKALIFTILDTFQLKKNGDFEIIYSVNPLYFLVNYTSGYIEEKNWNKYLIFGNSVNENKGLLKKYAEVWDGVKNEIKAINCGKENNYGKDYIKVKFNSDNDLLLSKPLKFHAMTIIIKCVFEEGGKFYPQVFLDDALYELWNCYSMKKIDVSEGIETNKTSASKQCVLCHY